MGLLDSVLGMATQALGQNQAGAVGGSSPDLLQAALGMLSQEGPAGLGGLMQAFQQGGLSHVLQSWIGTGENLPISADQLQSVLGSDAVAQLAQKLGLDPANVGQQLAQVLPGLVDQLTPEGHVPTSGLGSLADLASQFLGGKSAS